MVSLLIPLATAVVVLFVGAAIALATRSVLTVGVNEQADVIAVQRHVGFVRRVGAVLALAVLLAGVAGWLPTDASRVSAVVPAAAGAVFLLAVVLGELTVRVPAGLTRSATLETRAPRSALPRLGTAVVGVGVVLLAAVLGVGVGVGGPDDLGRGGRMLWSTCLDPQGGVSRSGAGPWPGSYYAMPIAVSVAVCLLLSLAGLVAVARRVRPSAESARLDAQVRRWSAGAIVHGLGVAVFATLTPLSITMAGALSRSCVGGHGVWAGVLVALAGVAGTCAVVFLARVLVPPVLRVDDLPPSAPGDPGLVGARL